MRQRPTEHLEDPEDYGIYTLVFRLGEATLWECPAAVQPATFSAFANFKYVDWAKTAGLIRWGGPPRGQYSPEMGDFIFKNFRASHLLRVWPGLPVVPDPHEATRRQVGQMVGWSVVTFSRIGYNPARDLAVLEMDWSGGPKYSYSHLCFLARLHGHWEVLEFKRHAVS